MIQTPEQFDVSLDAATRLLEDPPAEGTPAFDRLMQLMQEIAAYRPRLVTRQREDEAPGRRDRDRLAARLDAFEAQVTPHYGPHWAAMLGGGMGPA